MKRHSCMPPPLEHDIQAAFIRWVWLQEKIFPKLKLLFAVPNGGKRSLKTATAMKREGVRSGVPDIMLPVASKSFNGLAIEFKRPGKTTTENQDNYIDMLVAENWFVVVCTDSEAAIKTVKSYLGIADGKKG